MIVTQVPNDEKASSDVKTEVTQLLAECNQLHARLKNILSNAGNKIVLALSRQSSTRCAQATLDNTELSRFLEQTKNKRSAYENQVELYLDSLAENISGPDLDSILALTLPVADTFKIQSADCNELETCLKHPATVFGTHFRRKGGLVIERYSLEPLALTLCKILIFRRVLTELKNGNNAVNTPLSAYLPAKLQLLVAATNAFERDINTPLSSPDTFPEINPDNLIPIMASNDDNDAINTPQTLFEAFTSHDPTYQEDNPFGFVFPIDKTNFDRLWLFFWEPSNRIDPFFGILHKSPFRPKANIQLSLYNRFLYFVFGADGMKYIRDYTRFMGFNFIILIIGLREFGLSWRYRLDHSFLFLFFIYNILHVILFDIPSLSVKTILSLPFRTIRSIANHLGFTENACERITNVTYAIELFMLGIFYLAVRVPLWLATINYRVLAAIISSIALPILLYPIFILSYPVYQVISYLFTRNSNFTENQSANISFYRNLFSLRNAAQASPSKHITFRGTIISFNEIESTMNQARVNTLQDLPAWTKLLQTSDNTDSIKKDIQPALPHPVPQVKSLLSTTGSASLFGKKTTITQQPENDTKLESSSLLTHN